MPVLIIRDPIHGDIPLGPVCAAVVDHVAFQRLRYVRQNALLHMIWPGAVHTRFAHSLGTMHLAARAFDTLFGSLDSAPAGSLAYLRMVFQLAALLHDVGHCAFSHSIEQVRYEGRAFLGRAGRVAEEWGLRTFFDGQLAPVLQQVAPERDPGERDLDHELLGSFFIVKIFQALPVRATVADVTGWDPDLLAQDVNCILEHATPSDVLRGQLRALLPSFETACAERRLFGGRLECDADTFVGTCQRE